MNGMIAHSKLTIDESDVEAVSKVLNSGYISQGGVVKEFEDKFSRFIGTEHGLATNSGTSALHLVLLALGVGANDEVICPSYVCTAVLNAINYCGANPRLVDIDQDDFNIDVEDVRRKIGPEVKAVIVPHIFGAPAKVDKFLEFGIPVIEDCAQAIGATYKGRKLGSFGDIAIFSFYATKVMATGEGGMVITDKNDLFQKARDLREFDERQDYRPRYNYKMTDLQAGLGLSQLERLPEFIERRKEIARRYDEGFSGCNFVRPTQSPEAEHIFFRYVVKVTGELDGYISELKRKGIEAKRPVFRPLHQYLGLPGDQFPKTEMVYEKALSIPIYPSLGDEEVEFIIKSVREILG